MKYSEILRVTKKQCGQESSAFCVSLSHPSLKRRHGYMSLQTGLSFCLSAFCRAATCMSVSQTRAAWWLTVTVYKLIKQLASLWLPPSDRPRLSSPDIMEFSLSLFSLHFLLFSVVLSTSTPSAHVSTPRSRAIPRLYW